MTIRAFALALVFAGASVARGQGVSASPAAEIEADSIFMHANRMASAGDSAAAQKDYLRIVVDYSNSPHAENALLWLAQLAIAREDRATATQYLERLALEHPDGRSRAQGAFLLGRALTEEGKMLAACASLAAARAHVKPSDVELSNQITYYSRPCAAEQHAVDSARADSVDRVARAAKADSIARADSVTRAEAAAKKKMKRARKARKPEARKAAPADAKGASWSAQVAAYDTPEEAQRLAKKMNDRGYEARVTGEKPFRVRIGRYAERAEAVAMVAKLRDAKIVAIVVEAEKR